MFIHDEPDRALRARARVLGGRVYVSGSEIDVTEGQAGAILAVLAARGIPVADEARVRIETTAEARMLDRWLARVSSVSSVEELFAVAVD